MIWKNCQNFRPLAYEASKVICISRIDDKDKNLHVQDNDEKRRWNLYSQIAIENDLLICAEEAYNLTDICKTSRQQLPQPCTLLDTNEIVDIGLDMFT